MDILVRHNGVNITDEVLSYEREHKICTGVGTLTIDIERTTGRTFDPWDNIDIHENGDFKVRYFISDIIDSVPEGKVTLECQDESKRLVDFFIPESYIIETPSYTRTWIETFLDMAGVSYQFNTSSPGNLLSNHTQLGLTSAYEQILLLLQLSGWYMYFDGDGKAVIGSLETDLSGNSNSVDRSDILSINRASDDKMLRNRALVLGAFDPFTLSYAAADIVVHTRWNYDRNDVRSMVVANSNIPNAGSAYGIANMLIKEFARITIVKRLELHGARDFNLGEVCRVDSTVWRGKGLITTFGVRMSKDGLITDLTLDERCPRLFGFFDFGDYVYVGTYGDGVWRKHLKFDPTWYDFSDGLTNLEVTDLHINNGIFGSVGSNGDMHYANTEEGPWHPLTLTDLLSSEEDIVASGEAINYIPFSGISARATIVDKLTNNVKFGVDTASGINNGDYFLDSTKWVGEALTLSGIFESFSGVAFSGPIRGWIVEYDAFTGQLVGGVGSGIYPISLSGEYNFSVIDLENDGYNDYVSVRQAGTAIEEEDGNYNLGIHQNQPFGTIHDSRSFVNFPTDGRNLESLDATAFVPNPYALISISDGIGDERKIVHQSIHTAGGSPTYRMIERSFFKEFNEEDELWELSTTSVFSAAMGSIEIDAIYYEGLGSYVVYYKTGIGPGNHEFFKRSWNSITNTFGTETSMGVITYSAAERGLSGIGSSSIGFHRIVMGNTLYYIFGEFYVGGTFGNQHSSPSAIYINVVKINMQTGVIFSTGDVYEKITEKHPDLPSGGYFFPNGSILRVFQDGSGIKIIGYYALDYGFQSPPGVTGNNAISDWLLSGDETLVQDVEIHYDQSLGYPLPGSGGTEHMINRGVVGSIPGTSYRGKSGIQLTKTKGMVVVNGGTSPSELGYYGLVFNGTDYSLISTPLTDNDSFHVNPGRIYPIFLDAPANNYIALDFDDNYWLCDATSFSAVSMITAPAGFTLRKPLSSSHSFGATKYYWGVRDETEFATHIMPANLAGLIPSEAIKIDDSINFGGPPSIVTGEFVIEDVDYTSAAGPNQDFINIIYINLAGLEGASRYLVLQREGLDYTVIEEEEYPIRVDISNQSPVLTVGSGDNSFVSNYVYGDDLEVIFAVPSGFPRRVDDYRYTLLEPTTLGEVASGVGVEMMGLYITESGIFTQDIRTYSGGWQAMYEVPEGHGTRIETSNYGLGGQYIFVTASGDIQNFYQLDPGQVSFTSYSGLPDSRATIIRLDDRN